MPFCRGSATFSSHGMRATSWPLSLRSAGLLGGVSTQLVLLFVVTSDAIQTFPFSIWAIASDHPFVCAVSGQRRGRLLHFEPAIVVRWIDADNGKWHLWLLLRQEVARDGLVMRVETLSAVQGAL